MNKVENIYINRESFIKNGWSDASGPQKVQSPRYSHMVDKFKKQIVSTDKRSKSRSLSRELKIHRGKILPSPQRAALSPRTNPNGFDIFSPRPGGLQNDQQLIDLIRKPSRTAPKKQNSGPDQETMEMLLGLQSPRYREFDVDARREMKMSPLTLPTQRGREKIAKWNLDSASSERERETDI